MATLKLNKKPSPAAAPKRAPVRGGTKRERPTLAQAQAERAAHKQRDERVPAKPRAPARRLPDASHPASGSRRPAPPPQRTPPNPTQEGERLSKRMTALGMASRREADEWIEAGWVRVDGRVAVLGQRVSPDVRIEIDAAAQRHQAERVTILLNKPIGYVSGQPEDDHQPAVVLLTAANRWAADASTQRFSPAHLRHLAPAGRLDIDSTGLLVFTQDGRIAKLLVGEDSPLEKEYLVRVRCVDPQLAALGAPSHALPARQLDLLRHGLSLDGQALKPAKVSWQSEEQLRFALREGRKRQIRRMCEQVGLAVLALKRLRIGRIALAALPPGQWRYLAPFERF